MTDAPDLAAAVTARILAVAGVRGLFPEHPVAAAVLSVVRPASGRVAPLVEVETAGPSTRITARVSTDRTTASRTVLVGVLAALEDLLAERDWTIELEFAHIE